MCMPNKKEFCSGSLDVQCSPESPQQDISTPLYSGPELCKISASSIQSLPITNSLQNLSKSYTFSNRYSPQLYEHISFNEPCANFQKQALRYLHHLKLIF